MRVGIDARFDSPTSSGIGRYTSELVTHLLALDPTLELTLFVLDPNVSRIPPHPRIRRVVFSVRWYSLAEQLRFPAVLKREQLPLIHFPHFNVPLLVPHPFVVTIHDLTLHDFPSERATTLAPVQYWLKRRAYHLVIRHAVNHASRVITISKTSAGNLQRHFRLPSERLVITYEGATTLPPTPPGEDRRILTELALKPGFLLYVGNAYPHKNLATLLQALVLVRLQRPSTDLAIVGKDDYFSRSLRREAADRGLREGQAIHFRHGLSDAELVSLYRSAGLYVFPSLTEGFGLPGLEAMSFDLPVVASRASCLPEVLGPAALYFNPLDASDLAQAILRGLTDEPLRTELVQRGRAQVQRYSWRRLARETLAVYRSLRGARHG